MSTQRQPATHATHHTTPSGTGHHSRRRARRPSAPADPPKPASITYHSLDKDPVHGAEFRFAWEKGACFNPPTCNQFHIRITNPAAWAAQNLVTITPSGLPFSTPMRFHRLVVPQFRAFFQAAVVKKLADHILVNAGTYVPRTITNRSTVLSNHALGTAIDLNSTWNPYGGSQARRGTRGSVAELADYCADFGIYWGGWYSGNKDAMHFEAVRIVEGDALRAACRTHGVDPASIGLGAATVPVPTPRPTSR